MEELAGGGRYAYLLMMDVSQAGWHVGALRFIYHWRQIFFKKNSTVLLHLCTFLHHAFGLRHGVPKSLIIPLWSRCGAAHPLPQRYLKVHLNEGHNVTFSLLGRQFGPVGKEQ